MVFATITTARTTASAIATTSSLARRSFSARNCSDAAATFAEKRRHDDACPPAEVARGCVPTEIRESVRRRVLDLDLRQLGVDARDERYFLSDLARPLVHLALDAMRLPAEALKFRPCSRIPGIEVAGRR